MSMWEARDGDVCPIVMVHSVQQSRRGWQTFTKHPTWNDSDHVMWRHRETTWTTDILAYPNVYAAAVQRHGTYGSI